MTPLIQNLLSTSLSLPGESGEVMGEVVNMNVCVKAAYRIADLERQLAEAKRDAGRYRKVRSIVSASINSVQGTHFALFRLDQIDGANIFQGSVAQHFDDAIDAAMQAIAAIEQKVKEG